MTNKTFHFFKVLVAVGYYLLVALPLVVSAGELVLEWDSNDPTPDGYNLYQRVEGQSFDYDHPLNEDPIAGTTFAVGGIDKGVRYYFVVSALEAGVESEDSNEIEFIDLSGITNLNPINRTSTPSESGSGCFIGTANGPAGGMPLLASMLALAAALINIRRARP